MPQRISPQLAAVLVDTLGLAAALEWQAQRLLGASGTRCALAISDPACRGLPERCAATLFEVHGDTLLRLARDPRAPARWALALTVAAHEIAMEVRRDGVESPRA